MSTYRAPLADMRFVLFDVLAASALFARLGFDDATQDDLLALADAVREAGRPRQGSGAVAAVGARSEAEMNGTIETGRRGHLRILRDR